MSDVDDTIKISHVANAGSAAWNGLFRLRAFTGMSELYQALFRDPDNRGIRYLTGSMTPLRGRVSEFLTFNQFPGGELWMRPVVGSGTLTEYKLNRVRTMLRAGTELGVLIGDDTEADPQVYFQAAQEFPGRVQATYIHRIRGVNVPPSQVSFVTAYDIARVEYLRGRITRADLEEVAQTILKEGRTGRIIAPFQTCDFPPPPTAVAELAELDQAIRAKLERICANRLTLEKH